MSVSHLNRSIPEIFSDLVSQLTTLLRKEGQLARAEVSEKLAHIGVGIGMAIIGAVIAMPALVVLMEAIVSGLMRAGMAVTFAAALVGGISLVIGILLLIAGMGRLTSETLVPEKTLHQLQRDVEVAKHEASDEHGLNRAA